MNGIKILDEYGNIISNLSFGALYVDTNSSDQMIQIRSDLYDLVDISVQVVALNESIIPIGMRKSSFNSYKYVKLSEDGLNYPDILTFDSIPVNTNQKVFVQADIPSYADGGNFMCGINITAKTP